MNRIPIKFQIEPEAEETIRLCLLFKRSVAVEKDSDDPYLDFTLNVEMILEKQIYSKDDLGQLLDCFLQLNSWGYCQSFHRDLITIVASHVAHEMVPAVLHVKVLSGHKIFLYV
ncbi:TRANSCRIPTION REPRESSOR OFP6 [Salix purpurea]|uniref:Transcription repressor n=1 Tax=Salix purpurea TaxID=77065 RepID=A0A9Q0VC69_SALPP|nr:TRANSCRIPTION REPRESSOR OFP6 [Salix purpurea]